MVEMVIKNIQESIKLKTELLNDKEIINNSNTIAEKIIECYKNGNKVFFCGNGGSFADAQHLSAELSGRFYFDRDPLEVVLLAANVSYLTAVGNDYSYSDIFSREIKSSVKEGDILAEIETDKATMEFESFNAGTLLFIGIDEGQSASVDSVLAIIGPAGTDITGIAEIIKMVEHHYR